MEPQVKYRIVYEKAPRNYCAYSPDLLGCITTGRTLDETRIHMREAIAIHLEESRKSGAKVPPDPTGYVEILDFEPEKRQRRRPKPRPKPRPTRRTAKTRPTPARARTA